MKQTNRSAVAIVVGAVAVMTCILIAASGSFTYDTVAASGTLTSTAWIHLPYISRQGPPTPTLTPTPTPTLVLPTMLIVNATDDIDDGSCDSTHCSLREAIIAANERLGPDEIMFESSVFPLSGTGMIELDSPLPAIYDGNTMIDATGAQVIIDGSKLVGEGTHGLFIVRSSGNTIKGIRIQNVPGAAIVVHSDEGEAADDNTLDSITVINCGHGGPPSFTGRTDSIIIQTAELGGSACRNRVINCTVENSADDGIELVSQMEDGVVNHNVLLGNTVRGSAEVGIEIDAKAPGSASYNIVTNNMVEGNRDGGGIVVNSHGGGAADGNTIDSNIIVENTGFGIGILTWDPGSSASANMIMDNTIERNNNWGIYIGNRNGAVADSNCIKGNTIKNQDQRDEGVGLLVAGNDNLVYHNNFIQNDTQATDNGNNTRWDHSGKGNYWSDYTGKDENDDGIGDTPYRIPPNSVDNYPLMTPYTYEQRIYLPVTMKNYP